MKSQIKTPEQSTSPLKEAPLRKFPKFLTVVPKGFLNYISQQRQAVQERRQAESSLANVNEAYDKQLAIVAALENNNTSDQLTLDNAKIELQRLSNQINQLTPVADMKQVNTESY
jgi:hypothetical protein